MSLFIFPYMPPTYHNGEPVKNPGNTEKPGNIGAKMRTLQFWPPAYGLGFSGISRTIENGGYSRGSLPDFVSDEIANNKQAMIIPGMIKG